MGYDWRTMICNFLLGDNKTPRKMKIALDVDGVILNFVVPFAEWASKQEISGLELDYSDYWFVKVNGKYDKSIMYKFFEESPMDNFPFFDKSIESINSLNRSKRFEFHIATALEEKYTNQRLRNLEPILESCETVKLCHDRKSEYVIEDIQPDIAIEDKPKLIREFAEAGIKVFYPYTSYTITEKDLPNIATPFLQWSDLKAELDQYWIQNTSVYEII